LGGNAPVITINMPAPGDVDDWMITEPIALALQAFALFDEDDRARMVTVPLSADMGPVKSALRLTFDGMPDGNVCEADRLGAIMITLKVGDDVVEVSA